MKTAEKTAGWHSVRTVIVPITAGSSGRNIGQGPVSGWINTIRNHGGIVFVDLTDYYGVTQVVVTDEQISGLSKETVILVHGTVLKRDEETVNPNIATGFVEVKADRIELLGASLNNLPFEIDRSKETREDIRLTYRYLDLRNSKVRNNIVFRSQIIKYLRHKMEDLGFLEVQTPILAAFLRKAQETIWCRAESTRVASTLCLRRRSSLSRFSWPLDLTDTSRLRRASG